MKNLKPFDLNAALRGDPVVTREGEKVTHIAHFASMPGRNLIWTLTDETTVNYIYINGKAYHDRDSQYDLFMASKTKKLWIGVKKEVESNRHDTTIAYENLEELKQNNFISLDEIQIIQVEIEV